MLYYIVFYYLYIYIYIIARLLSLCQEKLKDYMGMMVYHIYICGNDWFYDNTTCVFGRYV